MENKTLNAQIAALQPADYQRTPDRATRLAIQAKELKLPLLPTTSIGSFPQTAAVRRNRAKLRRGEIDEAAYNAFNEEETKRWLKFQEDIGLDVLVHGEFERNDMVEYFGEQLEGFRFTDNGWVQSYGTRGISRRSSGAMSPGPTRLPSLPPSLPKARPASWSRVCSPGR